MFNPIMLTLVDKKSLEAFRHVKEVLALIPSKLPVSGKPVSCHMVCRLVGCLTGLKVVDGYFSGCFEHSWLVYGSCIIDPYPIGVLDAPLLLETRYSLPWIKMYQESYMRVTRTKLFREDMKWLIEKMAEAT